MTILWEAMFKLSNACQCFTVILIAILLFFIFLKCEIKQNLPYMKEIGIENVNVFRIFFALPDSSNEIS